MNLPINIIIGNGISLIAGIFLLISCIVNDEKEAYKYQFLESFILTISSVFFLSWTGVTTMGIAATRNMMVYKDKLTFTWTVLFTVFAMVFGLMVNTMGIIGLLPIVGIVQLTICNYYLKSIKAIKTSFIVNITIYIVYFFAIYDFASLIIQIITASIGLISLIKLIHDEKANLKYD
ncbi:MAG: YgjV family protein [Methanobrevibacter sp.]|nr:YgjV family protein [Methanobrevibacter sp.]